jgi:hypothetical protein
MVKRILLAGVFLIPGLTLGYAAYFLILQTLALSSLLRFGLTLLIVAAVNFPFYMLRRQFQFNRQVSKGILSIWILINLITVVRIDLNSLPYTITLLPYRQFTVNPGAGEESVRISGFSTELYRNLSLTTFVTNGGWEISDNGDLVQIAGRDEGLVWRGKPGEFIRFDFVRCQDCGPVTVTDQTGMVWEIDLQVDSSKKQVPFTIDADDLRLHKVLNLLSFEGSLLTLSALIFLAAVRINQIFQPVSSTAGVSTRNNLRHFPVIILSIFPVLLYALKIEPVIFNDDWCQLILPMHEETFDFFIIDSRRPMHLSLAWLFDQFLSLRQTVVAMQIAHLVVLVATGVISYYLLKEVFFNSPWTAFLSALLLVVFPSDYTHFYLSTFGIHLAYSLTLLGLYLFIKYWKKNQLWAVLCVSIFLLVGLLMYEAQLGLIVIWPAVAFILFKDQRWSQRISGVLIYYGSVILFLIWRIFIQPSYYQDSKLSYLEINIDEILTSLLMGFKTIFGGFQLPYQDASWASLENGVILAVISVVLVLTYLVVVRSGRDPEPLTETGSANYVKMFFAGLIAWTAGYFPIILNYPPNIWGHLSRVNIFTILGAILMIVSLVKLILVNVACSKERTIRIFSLVMVLLILLASTVQIQVQESYLYSWNQVKTFYAKLFQEVPQIEDNVHVLIRLSGVDGQLTAHRPLFTTEWEPYCAIRVLYDRPDVQVSVKYDTLPVPEFPGINVLGGGLLANELETPGTSDRLLGVQYDLEAHSMTVLWDIKPLFGDDLGEGYHPATLIQPISEEHFARELVE